MGFANGYAKHRSASRPGLSFRGFPARPIAQHRALHNTDRAGGFFSIASPTFASVSNLENILQQVSITAIMAVGLTFVILTAEIDLSVGAIANATAIVLTYFTMQPDYVNIANLPLPGAIAIIFALPACGALGLLTAFGVTRIGIPSFIMTLAMMQIGAGISAVLVRGQIAYSVPPLILTLGSKTIFGLPWIIVVAATLLLVAHLVLTYTRFGRYVYMVGGTARRRNIPASMSALSSAR